MKILLTLRTPWKGCRGPRSAKNSTLRTLFGTTPSTELLVGLVAKSCLTVCDPMDSSPPGSSVHGISQARILEWVAISFSGGSSRPRDQTCISCLADGSFTPESPGKPQHRVGTTQICTSCLLHRTPSVRCSWGYKSRKDLILLLESHLSDAFWASDSRIFAFNLILFL